MNKKSDHLLKDLLIALSIVIVILIMVASAFFIISKKIQKSLAPYEKMTDSEWVELEHYSAYRGEYLGVWSGQPGIEQVYGLEGLSNDEYLYVNKMSIIGNSTGSSVLIMKENSVEPIINESLAVKEIKINVQDKQIEIDDTEIINSLLSLRRNGEYQTLEWNGQEGKYLNKEGSFTFDGECNAVFLFDVECSLSWECYIEEDESGKVHFVCYTKCLDVDDKTLICDFDATNILFNI